MIFQSIRWRLQVWYGLVFLAVLAGFGVTAYALLRNVQLRNLDEAFLKRMAPLSNSLRPPPGGPGPNGPRMGRGGRRGDRGDRGDPGDRGGRGGGFPNDGPPEERMFAGPGTPGFQFHLPSEQAALFGSESNSFYYVVWGRDGKEVARSEAAPHEVPRPEDAGAPQGPPESRMRGVLREFWHGGPGGEVALVGRSIAEELAGLRRLAWERAGAGGVVLLLGLTGGWWVATRAIRPIEDISATAVKIAAGDLSQRISTGETDNELGRLAAVLNSTFARLEAAFAQQKQFTSDAAHELRTPITVMLTQTQTALTRERGAAEYRATVEACQRAAQRMRRLMESLLELARLDAGQETLRRAPFDLSKTVNECVELVAPLAEARGIKIHGAAPGLPCVGDPERMGQVITNLLDNAIEYSQECGDVRISGERQSGRVQLSVSNSGPGIAAEDLPRIFERFYRVDKARSGSGGHTGLGLAISKAIVEAHGGSLEAASRPGEGATFTVRLPGAS
jgi:two-component system OmpR family sensor kinase